jgi:mannose-6-phosphate isomerase-like protein (cupin superfamily)
MIQSVALYASDVVIDQLTLKNSQELREIYKFHSLGQSASYSDQGLTEYSLFSEQAGQIWKMEIYDFSRVVGASYHKLQNEWLLVLEGSLTVRIDDKEATFLPGQYGIIPAGSIHSLFAEKEGARFLLLHMPGYNFPKDRFYDTAQPEVVKKIRPAEIAGFPFFIDRTIKLPTDVLEILDRSVPLAPNSYRMKIEENGLTTYSIIPTDANGNRWSIDILELSRQTPFLPDIEKTSRFIILNGEAIVEVQGAKTQLIAGQSVRISPGTQFSFSSVRSSVRMLRVCHL